jgi:plastocyanin domain-containing protein
MKIFVGIAAVALLSIALFAGVATGEDKAPASAPVVVPVAADGVQRIEMLGGSYFFEPKHIVVKVNVPVEIKIKRESGVVPHNIVLKAPEAGLDINESLGTEPKVIKFTPKKTGKYAFVCDKKLLFFESHKDKGMEGILEVVE